MELLTFVSVANFALPPVWRELPSAAPVGKTQMVGKALELFPNLTEDLLHLLSY